MKHNISALTLAGLIMMLLAPPISAKDAKAGGSPAIYQAVIECKVLENPVQRLACFDRTVNEMAVATKNEDLIVLDRAAVRETRKSLFGFTLPNLRLFERGAGDADNRENVEEIESAISGIRGDPNGHTIFTIEGGARWRQVDTRDTYPKVGNPIRIRRAAFGSYLANIRNQVAVRVMRLP